MNILAAEDPDVHLTISASSPAEVRLVDLFRTVHCLWEEVYHVPGEEPEEKAGRKSRTSQDALFLQFPAGITTDSSMLRMLCHENAMHYHMFGLMEHIMTFFTKRETDILGNSERVIINQR